MHEYYILAFARSRPYTKRMQTDAHTRTSEAASRDNEREAKIAHMQRLVDEALASGISTKSVDDIWREAVAKFRHGVSSQ